MRSLHELFHLRQADESDPFAHLIALVAIAGRDALRYRLPVRLAHGPGYFTFFYCLHRHAGIEARPPRSPGPGV